MNVVLIRSSFEDGCECPVWNTRNYPDKSAKFVIDWYVMIFLIDDISIRILAAVIVTDDCRMRMFFEILEADMWPTMRNLNNL